MKESDDRSMGGWVVFLFAISLVLMTLGFLHGDQGQLKIGGFVGWLAMFSAGGIIERHLGVAFAWLISFCVSALIFRIVFEFSVPSSVAGGAIPVLFGWLGLVFAPPLAKVSTLVKREFGGIGKARHPQPPHPSRANRLPGTKSYDPSSRLRR